MKKFFKIFFIALGSLIGIIVISIFVALWLIVTPARITPVLNRQAAKYLNCDVSIGKVDVTFFSSFPDVGLVASDVVLVNPVPGSPSDTLVNVRNLTATVDVMELLRRKNLSLSNFYLQHGRINIFADSAGRANYDILPAGPTDDTAEQEDGFSLGYIDLGYIGLKDIDLFYEDGVSGMSASVSRVSLDLAASMQGDEISAYVSKLSSPSIKFEMLGSTPVGGAVSDVSARLQVQISGDSISAAISANPLGVSLEYGADRYLSDVKIGLNTVFKGNLAENSFDFSTLGLSVNGMELLLGGHVQLGDGIVTDLNYNLEGWPLKDIAALIPPAFAHYLEGIEITAGKIDSEGTVKGVLKDSTSMPMMDIKLGIEDGAVSYPDVIPLPLRGINGRVAIHTDMRDDKTSSVNIIELAARTPRSSVRASGKADRLLSDPRVNLTADADLDLTEFQALVPDTLGLGMKGRASGAFRIALSLSDIENMAIDRMNITGALDLTGLDVAYDTLALSADKARIGLKLPNPAPKNRETSFAALSLNGGDIRARMGRQAEARLINTSLSVELSDVRDTTKIPAFLCEFGFDRITAKMDSIGADVKAPSGSVSLASSRRRSEAPRFGLTLKSGELNAGLGSDVYAMEKIDLRAAVVYNKDEEEFFLRWVPRGFVDLREASISMASMPQVRVPVVRMDFTPREFAVEQAQVLIEDSDFNLSGKLTNVLPYFRGDSILRGDFAFTSNRTNLNMLMAMTSADEEDAPDSAAGPASEGSAGKGLGTQEEPAQFSGPYMVPKGTDILLRADIKQATIWNDTLSNIKGDIRIHDGLLVLDELKISAPATDMQLTAMYRTPRRNHLFAAFDLHLLEVEIGDLLKMIPNLEEIMPMLRSFGGTGEFHFAGETFLDSLYNMKMSTLRGGASVKGKDLTLIDGETFSRIVKEMKILKLLMSDTKNGIKIDSLSAEFTIFRNEVDVYPFLIAVDKYKAIVGGRHNLDMSFDYNISLVESPLPFRISVDVFGNMDDLKFKPAKAKYPDVYRPASRRIIESEQLRLRQAVHDALAAGVRREDD